MKRTPLPPRKTPLKRSSVPIKRSAIKNKISDQEPQQKKSYAIPKVSSKEKIRLKKYNEVRMPFLEKNTECFAQLPGCSFIATQIHHPEGRIGDRLWDVDKFKPLCHSCHHWIEMHPKEAKLMNFSSDRLKTAK